MREREKETLLVEMGEESAPEGPALNISSSLAVPPPSLQSLVYIVVSVF